MASRTNGRQARGTSPRFSDRAPQGTSGLSKKSSTVDAGDASEGPTFVTALARGLKVIRAFTAQNPQMTLSDVSRIVDLPRATVRRILLTLEALGYVESTERLFSLSPRVLTIARAYLSSSVLPRIAQPFLEKLSEKTGESCSVSILHEREVIYVARSTLRRLGSLQREVGTHLPAHCTSMGRVLLAARSSEELDEYLKHAVLTSYTRMTVTSKSKLRATLDEVRNQGFCLVDQELEMDLRAIAIPLRNAAGSVVAALNLSTSAARVGQNKMIEGFLPQMRRAAEDMRPLLIS